MSAVTDASETVQEPAPLTRMLKRVGVALAILSTVGLWAYAFLWPQPVFGKLDDATFPSAAEGVCVPVRAAVDALPRSFQAKDNKDRAATIDLANNQLEAMVTRLEVLPRGDEKATRSVSEWLDDWRQYLSDRRSYATRLATDANARFTVSQSTRDQKQITQSIDRFAEINKMASCATFEDVA